MACAKGRQCQCARGEPAAPAPRGLRRDGCKFAPSRHAALGGCSKLSTVTLRRISLWQADTASVIIYRAWNSIYILRVRHWRQMTVAMPPLPISRERKIRTMGNWGPQSTAIDRYVDPVFPASPAAFRLFGWMLPPSARPWHVQAA